MVWSDAIHEMIFSGGIKKGGTWGGPVCAAHIEKNDHIMEIGLWLAVIVVIYFILEIPKLIQTLGAKADRIVSEQKRGLFWKLCDNVVAFVHFGMWFQVLYYKINLKSLINLLQPCHISLLLNGAAVLFDGLPGLLCTIVGLPLAIGAVSALAFPATEGLDQPYEELSFFIQHWILLFVPFYLVSRLNFVVSHVFSFKAILLANWAIMVLHWVFFAALDRHFQVNVNFFLCPSEGMVEPFKLVPWYLMFPTYRTFLSLLMFVLSIPLCFTYVWSGRIASYFFSTKIASTDNSTTNNKRIIGKKSE